MTRCCFLLASPVQCEEVYLKSAATLMVFLLSAYAFCSTYFAPPNWLYSSRKDGMTARVIYSIL